MNLHPIAFHKESNCDPYHKEFSFVMQYVASPATRMLDSYTAAIHSKSRSVKTRKGAVLRHDGQIHIIYFWTASFINTVHWTVDFWIWAQGGFWGTWGGQFLTHISWFHCSFCTYFPKSFIICWQLFSNYIAIMFQLFFFLHFLQFFFNLFTISFTILLQLFYNYYTII